MTDLEERLRHMLHERAADITAPPALVHFPDAAARRRSRTPLLIAAAVAAVLAITLASVWLPAALSGHSSHRQLPSGQQANGSTRHSVVSPHATRQVALAWFGMARVPGFDVHDRVSEPGSRSISLRGRADHDMPIGCNGCAIISDVVFVFDAHAFDARAAGVTRWTRTRVGKTVAYRGSMTWHGVRNGPSVPTLAWSIGADRWAMVQGVTTYGGRSATLHALAAAVRPAVSVPIELPFRLHYVPDLPIVRVEDDRAAGYAASIDFGSFNGLQFSITLWNGRSLAGRYDKTGAASRPVGGLPGYVGPGGIAVPYHDGVVIMGMADQNPKLPPDQLLENARIADGIEWTNGDGRAPYVTAEDAIP